MSDQSGSIREVAGRIREICEGMSGTRYAELQEQAEILERIARYQEVAPKLSRQPSPGIPRRRR